MVEVTDLAETRARARQIVSPIIPEYQTADRLAIRNRANPYPLGPQRNPREFRVRRRTFDGVHCV